MLHRRRTTSPTVPMMAIPFPIKISVVSFMPIPALKICFVKAEPNVRIADVVSSSPESCPATGHFGELEDGVSIVRSLTFCSMAAVNFGTSSSQSRRRAHVFVGSTL